MKGEKDERGAEDKLLSYCTLWFSMLSFFCPFLGELEIFLICFIPEKFYLGFFLGKKKKSKTFPQVCFQTLPCSWEIFPTQSQELKGVFWSSDLSVFAGTRCVLFSAGRTMSGRLNIQLFQCGVCRLSPVGAQKPQVLLFHSAGCSLLAVDCVSFFLEGCNSLSE